MRAGGCTAQQALTAEAAATVKQAVALARRRGHAQVTPLHVATTMLTSSPTGLLRSACTLHSHSHPLHCKALVLCFNVALNRLPASSSSSPILGSHHHHLPSLSNALVAAFKRAQAHQRRGSIESQQQPLLTVKIELEQLIISILDDPSVSRVMREAGFSSPQVKANVKQAVSITTQTRATTTNPNPNPKGFDDVSSVVDSLASGKKRSLVVVGESLPYSEEVVKGVMDRVEKGEVPEVLKSLQFITLPVLFPFRNLNRDEVEQKVGELKTLVRSCCVGPRGGAVILYFGDLRWIAEYYRAGGGGGGGGVEQVMMEIRRLVYYGGGGDETTNGGRFWVVGVATHQTYKRCRVGNPSLEAALDLHPLTLVPTATLELTLNCHNSDSQSKGTGDGPISWPIVEDGQRNQLNCSKVSNSQSSMNTSTLPPWLQQYKEETKRETTNDKEDFQHQYSSEITLLFSSVSPSSSSISSYDQPFSSLHHFLRPWPTTKHSTGNYLQEKNENERPSGPSSSPNSASTLETMELEYLSKFKEINAENLKILCNEMEKKVPWQKSIIPEIASTILQCRSGMMKRKQRERNKEETWLFFQGGDVEGKEKVAREIASLVFGSPSHLVSIELSSFSSTRSDSTDDIVGNKRSRSKASHSYLERFFEAVNVSPHRVFLVEDIEQVDAYSQKGMKAAIEKGRIGSFSGEVSLEDAIIILSCETFDSRSKACSPPVKQKLEFGKKKKVQEDEKEMESSVCLDLNLCDPGEEEDEGDCSAGEVGLVESVDRSFFFKLPEDS